LHDAIILLYVPGGGYIVNGMHGGLCSAKCIVIPFCHYIVGFGCISDL